MRIGSLFSGIGGLELGLERAGLGHLEWQVEIDAFCQTVLAKHWPNVQRFADVQKVGSQCLSPVDVICGGFPCQDVSSAGKRAGLAGAKSGLWREFARIVGELTPRIVIVENVASGKRRWLPFVRRDLHLLGYRTSAYALSAADVGAPHLRRRVFVVAYADSKSEFARTQHAEVAGAPQFAANTNGPKLWEQSGRSSWAYGERSPESIHNRWREAQPPMVRVVHGVSRGLDSSRRRALGNSVVPQCAEVIGRIVLGAA